MFIDIKDGFELFICKKNQNLTLFCIIKINIVEKLLFLKLKKKKEREKRKGFLRMLSIRRIFILIEIKQN